MRLSYLWQADKKTKMTWLAAVLLTILLFLGGAGINALPQRCALCHSMKPEYYTWMVSPHGRAKVGCLSCHAPPGIKGFFAAKGRGIKEIYSAITGQYVAPIKMKGVVADAACERCHSTEVLENGDYGDIKVPHRAHKTYKVSCVKCHQGLAHGQIADRKVTYASDYPRWEKALGESIMSDQGYTKPDMDVCFLCHKLRNGPVACTGCHKDSKIPASHKDPAFQEKGHGVLANSSDIKNCDHCHRLLTENKIEGFEETSTMEDFISGGQKTRPKITAAYYSRVNTFCKNCHRQRPGSHDPKYLKNHREPATKDKNGCLTCHNNQRHRAEAAVLGTFRSLTASAPQSGSAENAAKIDDDPPSSVTCASCHPALHAESRQWQKGIHPVPLPEDKEITRYCYYCHRESECSICHGKVQAVKITKEE